MTYRQIVQLYPLILSIRNINISGTGLLKLTKLIRYIETVVQDYNTTVQQLMTHYEIEQVKGSYDFSSNEKAQEISDKLEQINQTTVSLDQIELRFLDEQEFADCTRGFSADQFVQVSKLLLKD